MDVALVTRGPLEVTVLEEGRTRIRHRHTVSSPIPAALERVPLRPGAAIVAGETVLARLAPAPASFLDPRTRAQAEAAARSAQAALQQQSAQVESARAELALAEKEFQRDEQLRRTGAIAQSQWDASSNRVDILRRRLDSAQSARQVADFQLQQARAALMQMESPGAPPAPAPGSAPATVAPAAASPAAVELRAPVTGRVLQVFEESARLVAAGQPILEVGDPADLEAEIEMLSTDAVNVRPGAPVALEQWGGGRALPGRVTLVEPGGYTKISALGVEEQRTLVRVDFDALPPGVFGDRFRVEARVTTWREADVLQVPTGALFRRGNQWMTFVLDGGRAKLTPVTIGANNGVAAQVLDGLTEGQRVIPHPPDTVANGTRVRERAGE